MNHLISRDPYVNKLYNPNETGAVTGTVLDENGNGIENAWIVAKNYLKINQTTSYADCSWIYTYTKIMAILN
ncbi:MAG: hypothetical protein IPP71_18295 [Bacteroidetes bacterium]|nr:hypothetical protein [Bacteroidota bacterium]